MQITKKMIHVPQCSWRTEKESLKQWRYKKKKKKKVEICVIDSLGYTPEANTL